MKIILCTTPIRPIPTNYPPFGSLAVLQSLKREGYDPYFYDIDCLRPDFQTVVRFFTDQKPDLILISAVVSTAYGYVKQLGNALKKELPNTPIVLGGNLAASAELLHRRCNIDVCVAGEGEKTVAHLAKYFENNPLPLKRDALRAIRGLTFLEENGEMAFTGYEVALLPEEFIDPDFALLEKYSKIENFIEDPLTRSDFAQDPRSYEPHRRGQKMSTIVTAKGCVARCTFCHRWDKGYRHFPVDTIVRRIKYLKEKYNVGFFTFGDENFGSDRKKLEELIVRLKPLDILYEVGGVRCRSVDPDLLKRLKESGCVALYYGMETGSPRILEVMEKNARLEDNVNAAHWTREAGLYTIFQLVLAMPGENNETVNETLEFVKAITEKLPEPPHKYLSTNYIQALPGTPVYEYARLHGHIGKSPEDEEEYLLQVSDVNACDDTKFLNFTETDYFTVQSWRHRILLEAERHWYQKRNWKKSDYRLPNGDLPESKDYYTQGGYFNLKSVIHHPNFYRYGWPLRPLYYVFLVLLKALARQPFKLFCLYSVDYVKARIAKHPALKKYQSLRVTVKENMPAAVTTSAQSMLPLRQGR